MEQVLAQALERVPSLVVLVALVVIFMRYVSSRDERHAEVTKATNKVIEENSRVIGGVVEVIRKCNGVKID